MSYLKLKTPKTIPSWAVHTRVGQIRERPLPNPRLELPLAVWMLLSCYVFPQGLRMVLIRANSSPSLSMPRWELLIPVRCYVRVVRTHLHPPSPNRRGELPFLYKCYLRIVSFPGGFVSHPQPPGEVSLSCVNVAYTVMPFPRGCARCWFKRTRLQVGSHWSHERR